MELELSLIDREIDRLKIEVQRLSTQGIETSERQSFVDMINALEERRWVLEDKYIEQVRKGNAQPKLLDVEQQQALASSMALAMEGSDTSNAHITLPVYHDATMTMQSIVGLKKDFGMTLPTANFVTPDSLDKVLQFYRISLPTFNVTQLSSTSYVLMEGDHKQDSIEEKTYVTHPSVYIELLDKNKLRGLPENSHVRIRMHYISPSKPAKT